MEKTWQKKIKIVPLQALIMEGKRLTLGKRFQEKHTSHVFPVDHKKQLKEL